MTLCTWVSQLLSCTVIRTDNLVEKTPNHPKALHVGRSSIRGSEAALMKEPAETSWKCLLHHRANAALSGRKQKIPGH